MRVPLINLINFNLGGKKGADGIDWGDLVDDTEIAYDAPNDIDTIDYDIDALRNEISVEEAGVYVPTDNIAKGNDAYNLLEWSETRNLFLNDLFKVMHFLFVLCN